MLNEVSTINCWGKIDIFPRTSLRINGSYVNKLGLWFESLLHKCSFLLTETKWNSLFVVLKDFLLLQLNFLTLFGMFERNIIASVQRDWSWNNVKWKSFWAELLVTNRLREKRRKKTWSTIWRQYGCELDVKFYEVAFSLIRLARQDQTNAWIFEVLLNNRAFYKEG